jgi:uncharacterized membrane protein
MSISHTALYVLSQMDFFPALSYYLLGAALGIAALGVCAWYFLFKQFRVKNRMARAFIVAALATIGVLVVLCLLVSYVTLK